MQANGSEGTWKGTDLYLPKCESGVFTKPHWYKTHDVHKQLQQEGVSEGDDFYGDIVCSLYCEKVGNIFTS